MKAKIALFGPCYLALYKHYGGTIIQLHCTLNFTFLSPNFTALFLVSLIEELPVKYLFLRVRYRFHLPVKEKDSYNKITQFLLAN